MDISTSVTLCALTADSPSLLGTLHWISGVVSSYKTFCMGVYGSSCQLTELKQICHRGEPVRHCISIIYTSLIRPVEGYALPFLILHFAKKSSIVTRIQETFYKIVTQRYRVPTTLHRFSHRSPVYAGNAITLREQCCIFSGTVRNSDPFGVR